MVNVGEIRKLGIGSAEKSFLSASNAQIAFLYPFMGKEEACFS